MQADAGPAICAFVGIFGVIGIIIAIAVTQSKLANESWAHAARQLRMSLEPGTWRKAPKIAGHQRDCKVAVDTYMQGHGESSRTYTRFRVWMPRNLGLGLKLTREGFFSGVAKWFGSQDIQIGDPVFDPDIIVKGSDARAVVEFLTPARRMRIHRFLSGHRSAVISDAEIRWDAEGRISDAGRITAAVRQMVQLAESLATDRADDAPLERAMDARRRGRVDEAMDAIQDAIIIEEVEDAPPQKVQPLEAKVLKSEMLILADRTGEAKRVLEEAHREAPDDDEIFGMLERVGKPPESAAPTDASTDAVGACAELFADGLTSLDTSKLFDEKYKDRPVRWTGTLKHVEKYSFDLVFGRDGAKAVVELCEVQAGLYGGRKVQAIVRLPPDAVDGLHDRLGGPVAFAGRAVQCDGFMRNLYVGEGSLVE